MDLAQPCELQPLLRKLTYNTIMTAHKREKSTNDFKNIILQNNYTDGQTDVKIQINENLTNKRTKRTFTWTTQVCPSHRYTPVENEDAGKWNGGGEDINRIEVNSVEEGGGSKQPLTEDSL